LPILRPRFTRRQALRALAALPWLAGVRAAAPRPVAPAALGYLPWWMARGWETMPLGRLDRLGLFDVPIARHGAVDPREWSARAPRMPLSQELVITLFGHENFDALFGDPGARERLLRELLGLLEQEFVSGLHLDFEGFARARPSAVTGFRSWLRELDGYRRRRDKGLSAFFPASDSFTPYDREATQRIDYWVAQLYDAHWVESKVTGALLTRRGENHAAVPRALARLSQLGVPRRAIVLSVPLYGWEWPCDSERPGAATRGRARLLSYAHTPQELMPNDRLAATALAREHGLRRDDEGTPYFAYRDGKQWRQGWFEDLASLARKLAPERAQGYAGLAFFPLGYDQGEIVEGMLSWWAAR
jgi:spore germination protein YaaH